MALMLTAHFQLEQLKPLRLENGWEIDKYQFIP